MKSSTSNSSAAERERERERIVDAGDKRLPFVTLVDSTRVYGSITVALYFGPVPNFSSATEPGGLPRARTSGPLIESGFSSSGNEASFETKPGSRRSSGSLLLTALETINPCLRNQKREWRTHSIPPFHLSRPTRRQKNYPAEASNPCNTVRSRSSSIPS